MIEKFTAIISATIKDFKKQMKSADKEAKMMAKEVIKPVDADISNAVKEINELKSEIAKLTNEHTQVKIDISEAKKTLNDLHSEINKMKQEQIKVKATIDKTDFDRKMVEMKARETEFKRDVKKTFYANSRPYLSENERMARSMTKLESQARRMGKELSDLMTPKQIAGYRAYQEALYKTRDAMLPFKFQQMAIQGEFFKLSQAGDEYANRHNAWMRQISKLGATDKKIKDEMMKRNDMMRLNFVRTAGRMMNMTTQATRISENYTRMGNAIYFANKPALAFANTLNKIANNGNAAVLALKMLGPKADTKKLNDMVMMINQGIMRTTMVAMAAAATSYLFYKSLHKDAAETNKAYAEAFKGMKDSLYNAFAPMRAVFQEVMIHVFNFIKKIGDLISKFNEAHPIAAKFIQGVMLLIPALTLILSPLAIGIGLFGGFQAALSAAWMFIGPLITGLAAMSGTVLVVAAAIVGLVMAFNYLWDNNEQFRNYLIGSWESIKAKAQEVWGQVKEAFIKAWNIIKQFALQIWQSLLDFWKQYGGQITQAVSTTWNKIKQYFEIFKATVIPIFTTLWEAVKSIVEIAWNVIKGVIQGALDIIKGIILVFTGIVNMNFTTFWEGIKLIFSGALKVIETIMTGAWEAIKVVISSAWSIITDLLKGWWETIKLTATTIWNYICVIFTEVSARLKTIISEAWQNIKTKTSEVWESIKTFISDVWNSICETTMSILAPFIQGILDFWNSMKDGLTQIWEGVKLIFTGAWEMIKSIVMGAVLFICNLITMDFTQMKEDVQMIWEHIKQGASQVWEGIKSLISGLVDAIVNFVSTGFTHLKDNLSAIWDATKSLALSAWEALKSGISNIVSAIKDVAVNTWESIKSSVISIANGIVDGARSAWESLKSSVSETVETVKGFFNSLGQIDLFSAGKAIIDGFLGGLKSAYGAVQEFVGGIADWIRKNKGPISYDKRLLIPAGKAIMTGLNKSMTSSFKSVMSNVYSMNKQLSRSFDNIQLSNVAMNDLSSGFDSMIVNHRASINSSINDEVELINQSANILLKLGDSEFETFVDNIYKVAQQRQQLRERFN